MLVVWILIFIASLAVLVKSADWAVESAEKIGAKNTEKGVKFTIRLPLLQEK